MRKVLFLIIMLTAFAKGYAQQTDPTLSAMILVYTDKAEKQLKSQEKAMMLQTTGHIWTKEEVDATVNFQQQFNDYLDSFRSVIAYAAQIYGFYYEVGKISENMGSLTKQIKKSPSNAVAVALTPKRNTIYRELIMSSVDIVNDIRQVCLSTNKMTEKERVEMVFGIRPKLKAINKLLQRLTLAVKYTSLSDVWREIDCRAMSYDVDKNKISSAAFKRWRSNGKIKPSTGFDKNIFDKFEIIDSLIYKDLWENGLQFYEPVSPWLSTP